MQQQLNFGSIDALFEERLIDRFRPARDERVAAVIDFREIIDGLAVSGISVIPRNAKSNNGPFDPGGVVEMMAPEKVLSTPTA